MKLLVAALVAASFAMPVQAQSIDPKLVEGFQHFVECAKLMVTDPAAHSEQCGPSRNKRPFGSISNAGGGSADTTKAK